MTDTTDRRSHLAVLYRHPEEVLLGCLVAECLARSLYISLSIHIHKYVYVYVCVYKCRVSYAVHCNPPRTRLSCVDACMWHAAHHTLAGLHPRERGVLVTMGARISLAVLAVHNVRCALHHMLAGDHMATSHDRLRSWRRFLPLLFCQAALCCGGWWPSGSPTRGRWVDPPAVVHQRLVSCLCSRW